MQWRWRGARLIEASPRTGALINQKDFEVGHATDIHTGDRALAASTAAPVAVRARARMRTEHAAALGVGVGVAALVLWHHRASSRAADEAGSATSRPSWFSRATGVFVPDAGGASSAVGSSSAAGSSDPPPADAAPSGAPAPAAAAADPSASTPSLDDASPDDDLSIPADFLCPIGQHVMTDPVLCGCGPQCGKSYDRRSIERWLLEGAPTCPTTSEPLDLHKLYPNRALKSAVEEWLANLGPRGPPADAMPPPSFADTPEAEALRRTCVQGLRVRRQKTGADKNRSEVPVADLRRAAVAAVAVRVAVAAEEEASRRAAAAAAAAESSSGSGSGGERGANPNPLEPAYGGALHVALAAGAAEALERLLADACTDRVRRGYLLRGGARIGEGESEEESENEEGLGAETRDSEDEDDDYKRGAEEDAASDAGASDAGVSDTSNGAPGTPLATTPRVSPRASSPFGSAFNARGSPRSLRSSPMATPRSNPRSKPRRRRPRLAAHH